MLINESEKALLDDAAKFTFIQIKKHGEKEDYVK